MGDVKVGEAFIDAVYITNYDHVAVTGLSPISFVLKLSDNTKTVLTVAEAGYGIYKVTNFTPLADTEYFTVWAVSGPYTIYAVAKLFKVGGGRIEDIFDIIKASGTGDLAAILLAAVTNIPAQNTATQNLVTTVDGVVDNVLTEVAGLDGAAMRGTDDGTLAATWTDAMATALTAYTAARAAFLNELDFALQEAIAALQTDLDNPSQYMANLTTLETRLSAIRAGYLDQLDFGLQEAIAAIPTVMVGTDGAALASSWTAALATALESYTAARGVYLDELDFGVQEAIAALQTDLDNPAQYMANLTTLETRLSVLRAGYLDQLDFGLQEAIAALQTDLDNPNQYKADVSALALEATLTAIKGGSWTAETLKAIYDLLDAILDLTETGGTVTLDGTEQDMYITDAPSGVFEPRVLKVDLTNMGAGDTIQVYIYERIKSGGGLVLKEGPPLLEYSGVQTIKLFERELSPNRYGVQTTVKRTAGTITTVDWEVLYAG